MRISTITESLVRWTGSELAEGRAVPRGRNLERDPSAMVHEELARLDFAMRVADFRGKSVLDVGCGTGYAAHYLASAGPREIVGVDASSESIRFARKNFPEHEFICRDAADLALHRRFDVVTSFEVIEHVPNPQALLQAAVRHLAPSGILILSTPNRLLFSLGRERSIVNKTHLHEFVQDEIRALLGRFFGRFRLYGQRHASEGMQQAFFHDVLREERKQLRERALCTALRLAPPSLEDRLLLRYPIRGVLNLPRWYHMWFDPHDRNVHRRTRDDFVFDENLGDAIWFFAVCSDRR